MEAAADFAYTAMILSGDKKKRLRTLAELEKADGLQVAVINYESVWRDGIFEALQAFDPDVIIADESQRIKSPKAKQSKAMHALGDRARYKLALSGTPVQNDCTDLWSQYRFLDPSIFGKNFYAFRARYAILGGFENRMVVGIKNRDELIKKEFSRAYRVTKAEALDLPEQMFVTRHVELEPKAKKIYESLKKNAFAELENGEITAPTVLTKLLRLQQATGGFIVPDEEEKPEQISTAKVDALEDIVADYVESEGKKLVVFVRFRAEIDAIKKMLEKNGVTYEVLAGDVPQAERGEAVRRFQEEDDPMVVVAQIQCAGLGITLHRASTCVYYSVDFNYANYSQSLARIHRAGQTDKCTYIHLVAKGTIDSKVLKALGDKEEIAKGIVDRWRDYF